MADDGWSIPGSGSSFWGTSSSRDQDVPHVRASREAADLLATAPLWCSDSSGSLRGPVSAEAPSRCRIAGCLMRRSQLQLKAPETQAPSRSQSSSRICSLCSQWLSRDSRASSKSSAAVWTSCWPSLQTSSKSSSKTTSFRSSMWSCESRERKKPERLRRKSLRRRRSTSKRAPCRSHRKLRSELGKGGRKSPTLMPSSSVLFFSPLRRLSSCSMVPAAPRERTICRGTSTELPAVSLSCLM
mmetsp:Transcript_52651/g.94507  ORF Transcript_52651/g.94507 Transcript_52651/m.94507 type:complete len:242 (-) Transcript_52651:61-786(-)